MYTGRDNILTAITAIALLEIIELIYVQRKMKVKSSVENVFVYANGHFNLEKLQLDFVILK